MWKGENFKEWEDSNPGSSSAPNERCRRSGPSIHPIREHIWWKIWRLLWTWFLSPHKCKLPETLSPASRCRCYCKPGSKSVLIRPRWAFGGGWWFDWIVWSLILRLTCRKLYGLGGTKLRSWYHGSRVRSAFMNWEGKNGDIWYWW